MRCSEKILLDTRSLTFLPNNPRKISQESLNRLCDSIRKNGYWSHRPIAVEREQGSEDRFVVLDGEQRVKAMRRLKRRKIPGAIYEDLTDDERTELILRSNINNGEWDVEILSKEYDHVEFESIGLQVELPEAVELAAAPGGGETESQPKEDQTAGGPDSSGDDDTDDTDDNLIEDNLAFYHRMLGDYLYPSDNEFQIPTLLLDNQPVHLELPFTPWGAEARYKKGITTYHFYVDDYRFEQLFKDPISLLLSGCRAIVEPNCSIHDQTPVAYALYQIYRKRYLVRYLQECGLQVWADLNVSPHLEQYNRLGIPDGYNAFFTRGVTGWTETTERHWEMARRISGLDHPNMCVYGGGKDIWEWCQKHDVLHVKEYINKGYKKHN